MIATRLLRFCDSLRRNGVRAAEGEVLDAFRALTVLDDAFVDRELLRSVLSCALAKSAGDELVFERVFDLHFRFGLGADADAPTLRALLRERGLDERAIDALCEEIDDDDALLAALLAGDAERLTEAIRAAVEDTDLEGLQSSLQISYFTSRLLQRLGQGGWEGRLLHARNAAALRSAAPEDAARTLETVAWELQERLRRSARRAIELELQKRTTAAPESGRSLLDRDVRAMDAAEIAALRDQVRRLALKLKARLIVRRRRAKRGRIDPRRTLRRSVATDGVPLRIELARRRPTKPELLVLCDVSDSVRQTSLFMLELVAALSDVLRRARSFVFVDRIAEVTQLFTAGAVMDPVAKILDGDVIPVSTNSDYGRALRGFWERFQGAVNRRTTVVVLGDGRSNYRPPEDWVLAEIRRRSRRLLWLSPEDRATWGYGDSEMPRFARHTDAVHVVRTVTDLARAVDRIAR